MLTRIHLIFAVGLLACATARAQVGVDFRDAIKQTTPAIVTVELNTAAAPPGMTSRFWKDHGFLRNAPQQAMPSAMLALPQGPSHMRCGFAVASDLVISCHVPQDKVDLVTAQGQTLKGRVVVRDHVTGLAVIRIDDAAMTGLAVATEAPEAGLPVLLSWLRDGRTLTGEASMIASEPNSDQSHLGFCQSLDTDFAPEKRGAPVVDTSGMLVGVVIHSAGNTVCLSTDHVARLTAAASVEEPQDLHRGRMGIQLDGQPGALIADVMDNMPAAQAELAAGDRVIKVGDRECTSHLDVMAAVSMARAGDEVTVVVQRGDEIIQRTVQLISTGPESELEPWQYWMPSPKLGQHLHRLYRLQDGKLVPMDEDAPLAESDIRNPRGLLFGNLQVERSELERSLKKLETEKRQQDELIKKLEEKIAQMELQERKTQMELKARASAAKGDDIARLEEIVEEIKKKLKSKENND